MAGKTSYSVTDLQKMLEKQHAELDKLRTRREKLSADLAECDARISELNGAGAAAAGGTAVGTKRATKKKKKVTRTKKAGGKRVRNQPSLRKVIMDVLPGAKKPLTLDEVMEKVLATGYRSNAGNFRQVVYLNLYNLAKKGEINHDSKTKLYSA